jgi:hypothetical protein
MIAILIDVTNGKLKKIDTEDKKWLEWFERNFTGCAIRVNEFQDLIKTISPKETVVIAIEKYPAK